MNFGAYIKDLRTTKTLSLREVASRVGVDPAYLSRVEAGKVRPSPHLVNQLAPVLECSHDDLALMAGQLPPSVRSALERAGSAPTDGVRELEILLGDARLPYDSTAVLPNAKRRGRPPKSASMPKTQVQKSDSNLSLFAAGKDQVTTVQLAERDLDRGDKAGSETSVERRVDPRNSLNALTSTEWIQETVSVWTQRGLGAGHPDAQIERQHPAPFSFTDVARLVKFFSKPGDRILDPFVGIGSTLKACALEGRFGIGIELNPRYAKLARERLEREVRLDNSNISEQEVLEGDARAVLPTLESDSIDFVVTSPPYWNILHKEDHKAKQERKEQHLDTRYSDDERDLGNLQEYESFLSELTSILADCGRVLKRKKYMALIVSDFRDKSKFIMFHADLANKLEGHKLGLRGIKVLYQRHKKVFPYGYPYAYVPNIHHQFILVLQNEK